MPGRPTAAQSVHENPLLPNRRLEQLYVTLLRCSLMRRHNRLKGANAARTARESIVTGTVSHLEAGDAIVPVAGDQLAVLAHGISLRRVLAPAPLSEVLEGIASPVARFAAAAGYAAAHQDKKHVTLAFSGPGVDSLQSLAPALSFAAQRKLSVIFVIETDADAELSNARHTEPLGLYGIPVDGNDVVALYRVAQESIARARRGLGPTLIDCKPWTLNGAADPSRKLAQALERRGIDAAKLKERTVARWNKEWELAKRKTIR